MTVVDQKNLSKNYWTVEENGMGAMAGLIDLIGRYPTTDEAKKYIGGLLSVIYKKDGPYGGWDKFRDTMGYEMEGRVPNGYWKDSETRMGAMMSVIDHLGHYPTTAELKKMKLTNLTNVIEKKDGGWDNFRKKMGYEKHDGVKRLDKEFLRDDENMMGVMQGVIDHLGHYPTSAEAGFIVSQSFIKKIYGDGGWDNFRKKMGYGGLNKIIVPRGYWENTDNGMGVMQSVIDYLGRYPNPKEFKKMQSGLGSAICKKDGPYGGWSKFRDTMGYGDDVLPEGWMNVVENGMGAMAGLIDLIGRYPTYRETTKHLGNLFHSIKKKGGQYGGWDKFKETMGYEEKDPIENLIRDMEGEEFQKIISMLGSDRGSMWDILAVKYGIDRSKVVELVKNEPSLGPYMGDFVTGITGVEDWEYVAGRTLPFDDDSGTIRKILEKSLFDSKMHNLGHRPSMGAVDDELRSLRPGYKNNLRASRSKSKKHGGD